MLPRVSALVSLAGLAVARASGSAGTGNVDFVAAHNARHSAGLSGFTVSADGPFGGMSQREYRKAARLGLVQAMGSRPRSEAASPIAPRLAANPPASIDWRDEGAVLPVRNQGQCGAQPNLLLGELASAAWVVGGGELITPSFQELMDCPKPTDPCGGGFGNTSLPFVLQEKGLCSDAQYPARPGPAAKQRCNLAAAANPAIKISAAGQTVSMDEQALAVAIATHGPVLVAIEADQRAFQMYRSGVFDGECGHQLDHTLLAVGYAPSYWILKNSWGPDWGMGGYVLLARGVKPYGQCGIVAAAATYLVAADNTTTPSV